MGIRKRAWKHARRCEAIVELDGGRTYVCGRFTRERSARCDEHRPALRRDERPAHERAS